MNRAKISRFLPTQLRAKEIRFPRGCVQVLWREEELWEATSSFFISIRLSAHSEQPGSNGRILMTFWIADFH